MSDSRPTPSPAAERPAVARRWTPRWIAGVIALVVAVVGTIAVGLQAGSDLPGGPDVLRVASATRLAPTDPAPAARDGRLALAVEGVAFPDLTGRPLRWQAVGARRDELGGRAITTVAYRDPAGVAIGYSIVAGAALAANPGDGSVERDGTTYRVFNRGGRITLAWERAGHTCVLDAPPSVDVQRLVDAAAAGA